MTIRDRTNRPEPLHEVTDDSLCPLGQQCTLRQRCVRAGHRRTSNLTVGQAIDYFLCRIEPDVTVETMRSYRPALEPLRALQKPIRAVTVDDLQAIKSALQKRRQRYGTHPSRPPIKGGLSPLTVHKIMRTWRRLFNFLAEEKIIGFNPAAKLKLPRRPLREPKHALQADALRLYRVAATWRDRAILGLLSDTAIRVGGLISILLKNTDLGQRRVKVHEKGNKEYWVGFSERTAHDLQRYIDEERSSGSAKLFVGRRSDLAEGGVYQMLHRLALRAGVTGRYNPHAFRHGLAKKMLADGRSLPEVQAVLHHEDPTTTARIYVPFMETEVEQLYYTVSGLLPNNIDSNEA